MIKNCGGAGNCHHDQHQNCHHSHPLSIYVTLLGSYQQLATHQDVSTCLTSRAAISGEECLIYDYYSWFVIHGLVHPIQRLLSYIGLVGAIKLKFILFEDSNRSTLNDHILVNKVKMPTTLFSI